MEDINYKVSKGRITRLWKERLDTSEVITGIKSSDQTWFDCNRGMRGGNGTYRVFGEYIKTALFVKATIYEPPVFEFNGEKYRVPERIIIDCYEDVRQSIGKKVFGNLAITDAQLENLQKTLCGKKQHFFFAPLPSKENEKPKALVIIGLEKDGNCPFKDIIELEKVYD